MFADLSSESAGSRFIFHNFHADQFGGQPLRGGPPTRPPILPLERHPIPQGYRIEEVRTPGLARVAFGEETGNLHRINLPASVLIAPDNFIVGIIRLHCLLRLYYTVLYGRQPVKVHLYSGNIELLSEEELRILPFHRLVG